MVSRHARPWQGLEKSIANVNVTSGYEGRACPHHRVVENEWASSFRMDTLLNKEAGIIESSHFGNAF